MTERLKILVVDDEQVILDSARKILHSDRLQVIPAPDAESAQQVLLAERPDMKLLDFALEHDPGLLIIITTGYSTVENAVAALKRGAFDFLPKPFTCDELLSVVARARCVIELRLNLEPRKRGADRRGDFQLGAQTWARPERDGSALLGATDFHLQTVSRIERVELPEVDAELRQGGRLACLLTIDGLAHTLWSPLSGRVLFVNGRWRDPTESLRADPQGTGWIARIRPGDLEGELPNLIES
jgi:glycine cleavage system H lipoate-binding protein/CheY-like chemotaxis protein